MLALACAAAGGAAQHAPMRDAAVDAARQGLENAKGVHPQLVMPDYDREQVKALSQKAAKLGAAELERLRAKHPLPGDAPGPARPHEPDRASLAGRVVVALSSSMPEAMLASYMSQLDGRPESLVVLRGFVGGAHAVRPTGVLMERIRRKTPGDPKGAHVQVETVVDPLFFRQLALDQVPAVVWLAGVTELAHCDEQDYSKATVIVGAVSVEAALREARKAGANVPEAVIAKYRGIGWERKP